MNPLLTWWTSASPEDKKALAEAAGTTVPALHQSAHAYRSSGELSLSPELARRIEIALNGAVKREQMCPACSRCEYVSKCTN